MGYCTHCGHALGIGRFCTNCGQPIPGRHESVPSDPSPAPQGPPPPPRYPLYADTPPPGPRPTAPPTVAAPPPVQPPLPAVVPTVPQDGSSGRGPWLLWAVLGLVLAVVVGVVLVLVLGDDDEPTAQDPGRVSVRPEGKTSGSASDAASTEAGDDGGAAAPGDLTPLVGRIAVPGTAAGSTDAQTGAPVTFEAAHLVDGDPTTCWRVDGDASGTALTITFSEPVRLTEVGLINGYAKSYPGYDGYRLNRRVLAVHWVLDDGTSVAQSLRMDRGMQTIPLDAGTATRHLRLEIDAVSPPAPGPLGKDFTAISELRLVGSAAS